MYDREAAIVGIGTSDSFGFDLGKSPMRLQVEALSAALSDAGLSKSHIDGFATAHGSPNGVDYDEFVVATGLDCRWVSQMWSHGRWATSLITDAALAVSAGLADYVAIANASISGRGYGHHLRRLGGHQREGLRDGGGGHGEWDLHGFDSPGAATSLVAQRYMDRYGATTDDLASISIAIRANARRNPMAIMRDKPMDRDAYDREPAMIGPFRRPDFCLASEGATCLIVTTVERARDLVPAPVTIAGFEGIRASRDDYILFARPGLGVGISAEAPLAAFRPPTVYARSGVDRADIGALYVYDSFSSNVWMVLERFGFCPEGQAPAYVRDVGLGLDATMPVNSNGGLLSEAHLIGMGHIVEMVRQIRGAAGERQIANVHAVQWATPIGDSLILTGGDA